MSQENVEIVRRVYARWEQGDFAASVPLFEENVTLVVRPEFPDGGTFVGREGTRAYMTRFLDAWEALRIAATSFREIGDTVLVKVRQAAVGRSSGIPSELDYFQLWTFRGGKVIRVESILTEADALEAAGLRE